MIRVVLLLISLCFGNIEAEVFYVSPQGSDSLSGKNPAEARKSPQKVMAMAKPGDTIFLLPGEYRESLFSVRAGKPDMPIVLQGLGKAIIKGNKRHFNLFIGHDYIHVKDVIIDGLRAVGETESDYALRLLEISGEINSPVHGVVVTSSQFKNALTECLKLRNHVRFTTVSDNRFENCGVRESKFSDERHNSEGIYIGTAPENLNGLSDTTSHIVISGNQFFPPIGECIDIKENAHHIAVVFNHCEQPHEEKSGGINVRGSDNRIENNTVNNGQGAGIRIGGDHQDYSVFNHIQRNTLSNNKAGGIKIQNWPQYLCGNQIEQSNGQKPVRGGRQYPHTAMEQCYD